MNDKTISYNSINRNSIRAVGGRTGSVQVKIRGDYYQYKPPIEENARLRRAKAEYTDSENFGEVLASRIAKAFDNNKERERVPLVAFVTNPASKNLAIASKYLVGDKVRSLDDYFDDLVIAGKTAPDKAARGKSHIKLIDGPTDRAKGHYNINDYPQIKKELAAAVARSALVGDHDINPGNMIVITTKEGDRLGRIDYGHAFNDLKRYLSFGGRTVHKNNIIDFFNRGTVDGLSLTGAQSKLWRDYPGLVPSKEMVGALKELAEQQNAEAQIERAVKEVKQEIIQIFIDYPKVDKQHVIKSFQRMYEQVSGKKLKSTLSIGNKINIIFKGLEEYAKNNIAEMAYAAEIMDLQVKIREAVQQNKNVGALRAIHTTLKENKKYGSFSWIKEAINTPPFEGNFDQFVAHQKVNIFKNKIEEFLKSNPPSHEQKLARDLKAIAINPKKSEQEKTKLLGAKLKEIGNNPQPKSSLFSKLIDCLNALLGRKPKPMQLAVPGNSVEKFSQFKAGLQCILHSADNASEKESEREKKPPR